MTTFTTEKAIGAGGTASVVNSNTSQCLGTISGVSIDTTRFSTVTKGQAVGRRLLATLSTLLWLLPVLARMCGESIGMIKSSTAEVQVVAGGMSGVA